jgi:hypothetical protein
LKFLRDFSVIEAFPANSLQLKAIANESALALDIQPIMATEIEFFTSCFPAACDG